MCQIDKLRIIESDAVPKEGAKIEALSTSIKITHTCGCVLVEHFAAGKQIVLFVRAYSASSARADALVQARQQFGPGAGSVTIVSCKEV